MKDCQPVLYFLNEAHFGP